MVCRQIDSERLLRVETFSPTLVYFRAHLEFESPVSLLLRNDKAAEERAGCPPPRRGITRKKAETAENVLDSCRGQHAVFGKILFEDLPSRRVVEPENTTVERVCLNLGTGVKQRSDCPQQAPAYPGVCDTGDSA